MRHTFRYVVDEVRPGAEITLADADGRHLVRVVRRGVGDEVELIDKDGALWAARVVATGPPVVVQASAAPHAAPERLPLTLAVGLCEANRMDLIVEKASELGVARVRFFTSERARRTPDAQAFERRRTRLARVAEAAARQSGYATLLEIGELATFVAVLTGADPARTVLLDGRAGLGLTAALGQVAAGDLVIIVGPDAGLSEPEIAAAADRGVLRARLGDATLRAETAAIAAAAVAAAVRPAGESAPG